MAANVIAGTIALDGLLRVWLTLIAPHCSYNQVRLAVAIIYLVFATVGFFVVRWDAREARRDAISERQYQERH